MSKLKFQVEVIKDEKYLTSPSGDYVQLNKVESIERDTPEEGPAKYLYFWCGPNVITWRGTWSFDL